MKTINYFDQEISLGVAAREVQAWSGKGVNLNALIRWSLSGARGIKLRTTRHDRRLFTTRRWLNEFLTALKALGPVPTEQPASEQPRALGNPIMQQRPGS
jgi:hypothetical protein